MGLTTRLYAGFPVFGFTVNPPARKHAFIRRSFDEVASTRTGVKGIGPG